MSPVTAPLALPELACREVAVLCVDDDPAWLDLAEDVFERDGRFDVRTAAAPERLDGVDCVVAGAALSGPDGRALLDAVRERAPDLPVVLLAGGAGRADGGTARSREWTTVLPRNEVADAPCRLARRVHDLVDHRRTSALARRALAAMEVVRGGLAIADPDGMFTYVDGSYADRFGYDREELVGRSWRDLYTDAEADRIEGTALSTVEDGWRWVGECAGQRRDGGTVSTRTTIAALDDGSLVFAVPDRE